MVRRTTVRVSAFTCQCQCQSLLLACGNLLMLAFRDQTWVYVTIVSIHQAAHK